MCNVMCILSDPKCTDVELIELGNILQESFGVRSDAGVVPRATGRELKVVHILKTHNHKHTILAWGKE